MANSHKDLMRRFYDEVANAGNLDFIDETVSPDVVDHEEFPGLPDGREGVKAFFKLMRDAFPDLQMRIDDLIEEGDMAVARITISGTHRGRFMDLEPTGKRIEIDTIDIVRFEGDVAVEHWGVTDSMAMMQQLGAIPEEARA